MGDNKQNHLVTLGSMLVKRRVGKPVLEDRPRSEATTSTSSTSSTTLATTQESVAYSAVVGKARGSLQTSLSHSLLLTVKQEQSCTESCWYHLSQSLVCAKAEKIFPYFLVDLKCSDSPWLVH